jgi:hypothetical protein
MKSVLEPNHPLGDPAFPFFCCCCFIQGLPMQPRLALNSQASYFSLMNAWLTGMCLCAWIL